MVTNIVFVIVKLIYLSSSEALLRCPDPSVMAAYVPFGEAEPLTCRNNADCPATYECRQSLGDGVQICCLTRRSTTRKLIATDQLLRNRLLVSTPSICPNGAPSNDQSCTISGSMVCPRSYICTVTTGSPVCCPHFGICQSNLQPYVPHGSQLPQTCSTSSHQIAATCPTGFSCQLSTTGNTELCCPNFGLCENGLLPYTAYLQSIPIVCESNPSCPSGHTCSRSSTGAAVCCPVYVPKKPNPDPLSHRAVLSEIVPFPVINISSLCPNGVPPFKDHSSLQQNVIECINSDGRHCGPISKPWDRKWSCQLSLGGTPACCPDYGACIMQRKLQSDLFLMPQGHRSPLPVLTCSPSIPDKSINKRTLSLVSGFECPKTFVCEKSTTNWHICCTQKR